MASPHAGDVAATFCATLIDEWVAAGVRQAVISPGSRSTPLALAAVTDGRLRVTVHHDERAAAFIALGVGVATGVPAVVVTTSGTAAVELHPAVVEAHEARVPMLVCTADRPPWLQGLGAPQTIDQHELFGSSVRLFVAPGVPDLATMSGWRDLASSSLAAAVASPPGPVHLNLAFDEPLLGHRGELPPRASSGAALVDPAGQRALREELPGGPASQLAQRLAPRLEGQRVLVVAGGGITDPDAVLALAGRLGWPVVADPRSGCRVPDRSVIAHADALLRHASFAHGHRPTAVLRLGQLPASKVLSQWLDRLADAPDDAPDAIWQVGVDADGTRFDPGGSLDDLFAAEPGALCATLGAYLGSASEAPDAWLAGWRAADDAAAAAIADVLASHDELTEPAVARAVAGALPDGARLVVSSSMPVRDLEWYAAPRPGIAVLANRGANGIDGVVSTATGVALAAPGPVAVLIGDVAFLHDTNALLGLAKRGVNLTVVVVDNDGGGIFSFLPQAAGLPGDRFEMLFGTPHGVDLTALAAAHGIEAKAVDGVGQLAEAVASSCAAGGVRVLVVRTDRAANPAVHDQLHSAVAVALDALVGIDG
jgi:2-succinyl-5-enolpyruvyl-6-hydroxy-3-cyclohexene-1-carboxylate synthase